MTSLRFALYIFILVALLLPAACGSEPATPPLAEPGQPTLVYVFTDG